jgi:glycosyltransferase involved in cell wall biosynthesis
MDGSGITQSTADEKRLGGERVPEISIGMPVYNGERYISEAIESILNQSFPDFELIICDNKSTDSTRKICEYYAERDGRIRYVRHEENIGGPRNWNYVFSCAKAPYFKWAPANDTIHRDMLAKCKEALDSRPDVVVCFPRTILVDEIGKFLEYYAHDDALDLQSDSPCDRFLTLMTNVQLNNAQCGLIRTDILRKTGLEGIYERGDIGLMAELSLHGKFYRVAEYLSYRRMSASTFTTRLSKTDLAKFIEPGRKKKLEFSEWKFQLGILRSIFRSPIRLSQKIGLFLFRIKVMFWNKRTLLEESSSKLASTRVTRLRRAHAAGSSRSCKKVYENRSRT